MQKRGLGAVYLSNRVRDGFAPAAHCPLTAVVAPMGYGKTTAIDWFLSTRVREENAIVVRVSIYSGRLSDLWKRVQGAFSQAGFDVLGAFPCPKSEADTAFVLDELAAALAVERPCYVFLDDFHLIEASRAAEFVCKLALRLPEQAHVIVASRDRFLYGGDVVRLGRRLHQIGVAQLRLGREDLFAYARRGGLTLSAAQADALLLSTEGWFSAVYLSLRTLQEQGELPGEESDIYDLFTAALIDPLSEESKAFLAAMSLADECSAPLAGFITGRADAEETLLAMTEQNAFVTRLPDGNTFRFHHMMKTCAQKLFFRLPEERQRTVRRRYGAWFEQHRQVLAALDAYALANDSAGWLRVVAADAGEQLASLPPETALRQLEQCEKEALFENPQAVLVLLRRLFSWGNVREMLALREELLCAVEENGALDEAECSNLLGECDLIMSFLSYNDIRKMSVLHQSAGRQMTRPALSIQKNGSFTFGSPSVLMMFHRESGKMDEEVAAMNRAMPHYYRVTGEHGAGAELAMEAEAALLRGQWTKARLLLERARCRAETQEQEYLLVCCDFLSLRLALLSEEDPAGKFDPGWAKARRAQVRQRHDTTLLLTFESALAYEAAACGQQEDIPPFFAKHELHAFSILNPAKPMLAMIENQVDLAQGEYARVIGRSDALSRSCEKLHYGLVLLHVRLQTAAAYEKLGMRAEALTLLREAERLAAPDGILAPFAENSRFLAELYESLAARQPGGFFEAVLPLSKRFLETARRLAQCSLCPKAAELLSGREVEIALLAARRTPNRDIAAKLFLSEGTVKQYVNRIYSKLSIEGDPRTKRAQLARALGLEEETAKAKQ